MPPQLATILTLGFIVYLFRREGRENVDVSNAIWIPLIWILVLGARSVSEWFMMFGLPTGGGGSVEDGSPLDAGLFLTLIVLAIRVLNQRGISLGEVIRNNKFIAFYLGYCFLAIFWSEFPFVAFKRWIKILGLPLMVLIVFTEGDFEAALARLMKRFGYVVLPISVLFIKYYPQYGRTFSQWTGAASNTGITTNKNLLGSDCFILGVFLFWHLLNVLQWKKSKERRTELLLTSFLIFQIWWLLRVANSSTSLLCSIAGMTIIYILGRKWVDKRMVGGYVLFALFAVVAGQVFFGVFELVPGLVGRDSSLTGRTEVWADILKFDINPLIGVGFESFWLGERLDIMWAKWTWRPNQAHNGYLETYINLGGIGLALMIGVIVNTFIRITKSMQTNFEFSRLRLGFLFSILAYNWTEATFKGLNFVWFVFYLIAMEMPKRQPVTARLEPPRTAPHEEFGEAAR